MGFADDIRKFALKCTRRHDDIAKNTVVKIAAALIERTPVGDSSYWVSPAPPGYTGGHARMNWNHSTGAPAFSEILGVDPSGAASLARVMSSVAASKSGSVHYIFNSVPYFDRLENGYSPQAPPNGIIGLTVMEFNQHFEAATEVSK